MLYSQKSVLLECNNKLLFDKFGEKNAPVVNESPNIEVSRVSQRFSALSDYNI